LLTALEKVDNAENCVLLENSWEKSGKFEIYCGKFLKMRWYVSVTHWLAWVEPVTMLL